MSSPSGPSRPWQAGWLEQAGSLSMRAWRGVEAQHIVATMRLVDSLDEQTVLEQVLEASKPAMPAAAAAKHYLLATPFRYRPGHASRFRRAGSRGIWYGAGTVRTVCAELAYWRWRFLTDSDGLAGEELLTEHTLFSARVDGLAIDLRAEPWSVARDRWMHSDDYGDCQALAEAASASGIQWILSASVRDPGGRCAAVLEVAALDDIDLANQQTWHCRATRSAVRLIRDGERFEWTF